MSNSKSNDDSKAGDRIAPELLAPAGNFDCATAAIENGADAIYFGLQAGFNARARAANFAEGDLPELMQRLHSRGVKGYVTLNTLVFTDELYSLEKHVRYLAETGVDACLVQDLGVARLVKAICPEFPIHASTQMTMTCAETIEAVRSLDIERVVLGREISIDEIRKIRNATDMPLEVFVHGALCVAYSGQCLTSESLGGRSANRGQCAQACRLDYRLSVDGQPRELGEVRYLLSPQDLAAIDLLPQLIDCGVCSVKIEGRLKTPEYVANVVSKYRTAIDQCVAGNEYQLPAQDRRDLEMSFSRGFSPGWLEGNNHKRLVPGTSSSKRGVLIGSVIKMHRGRILAQLSQPLKRGDGIVLEGDRTQNAEIGGRVYDLFVDDKEVDGAASGTVAIALKRGLLAGAQIKPGQTIYQTDDPALTKKLRATFDRSDPNHKLNIDLDVTAVVGQPIKIDASVLASNDQPIRRITITSEHVTEEAKKHAIDTAKLTEQLSRLGKTAYRLNRLTANISGRPMIPLSVLGRLRRDLVQQLNAEMIRLPDRTIRTDDLVTRWLEQFRDQNRGQKNDETKPNLWVLCRSMDQLSQALACSVKHIYADFHDIREHRDAVRQAQAHGAQIYLASLRIHKPGESGLLRSLVKHKPDGILVRNLAAMKLAVAHSIPFVTDFSLNVTNPLTMEWLLEQGALRVAPSYDLNRDQMMELMGHVPTDKSEIVVHQHMPMFHMEHCVFCSVISPGTNKTNCGRPCDEHRVHLSDRVGVNHVLHADIGCRNTLYNGNAQSGAEVVQPLVDCGVKNFRIELLADQPMEQTQLIIDLYRQLIDGRCSGSDVWRQLKADNRLGVTRGTLEQPRNPLAIL